ncbi:MAG: S1C family serine protease [Actinomycetota bacterium]
MEPPTWPPPEGTPAPFGPYGFPVHQPTPEPPRHRRRLRGRSLAALLVLALIAAGGGGFALNTVFHHGNTSSAPAQSIALIQSDESPPASSLTEMIKKVLPSVVNIHVTELSPGLFGGGSTQKAEGSGIVLSKSGLILTNNHVVANATKVTVAFTDGRDSVAGTVVGTDPQHDLALVRVSTSDLVPITLGHSKDLQLGDAVTALGFPLDLGGPTVTRGIVSGLDRDITVSSETSGGSEHLTGLIQTDAAINPGNSGGPLVDANGNLVGIDTAAASAASAENTGFAIAIDDAVPVIKDILNNKPEQRAWMGVIVQSVDSSSATNLGLPASTQGALVASIVPGSPAAASDLKRGDVIQAVDGKSVTSSQSLTDVLTHFSPGDHVTLDVLRSSGKASVDLTLAQRPASLTG